jgi:hypothetical protein
MTLCSGGEPNRAEDGDVKLSWGEGPGGRMLHISQVPSGLACGCACPGCGEKLVAKKGRKQKKHFAHYSGHACRTALESMLHRLAKQVIADRKIVKTPAVVAEYHGQTRLVRGETDFRLDEVVLEQWLDGMRPDIVARRTVKGVPHELLIEIKVAHACCPEKVALIRKRRIATVEIDLSKLARHASSQQEMEDAILSAPRIWLFNAREEAAVAEMRLEAERLEAAARQREEQRRQREEAQLKVSADRLVAAFRKTRAAGQRQTKQGGEHLARVLDAGLDDHVGLEITGSACFGVADAEWQAAIVDRFAIGKNAWFGHCFSTAEVAEFLHERRFMRPDFPLAVSEALGSAVRAIAPHFRSPSEAVEAYLGLLMKRRVVRQDGRDWRRDEAVAENARKRIERAVEGRNRAAELAERLRELLEVIPQAGRVEFSRWMDTAHPGLSDTPLAIAIMGGLQYPKLVAHLGRLREMLARGGPVEEDLLGLPLERQLAERREEWRLAEDERARQAEEAERNARLAADRRKKTLARLAVAYLGHEDGTAWLAQPWPSLGGMSVDSVDGLTETEHAALWSELYAEYSRRMSEAARLAAINEVQERLRTEAGSYGDPDWIDFWMRSQNRLLGGRRPIEVCVDQAGLEECRKALRQEPRRLRRA